jgi:hypothetical protein
MLTPFVLGQDPNKRRKEVRNKKTSKSDPMLHYLNFLTHAPMTIIPVTSILA